MDKVLAYEVSSVLQTYAKLGYDVQEKPYEVNVLGIRAKGGATNSFNDAIGILFKDFGGLWNLKLFQGTTDPGAYWLKNPMNVKGTAILVPGQYRNSHRLGKHRGEYEALVQAGRLKIWRDRDRDAVLSFTDPQISDAEGINIHRASANQRSVIVDKWSAGCQVIADAVDYMVFMFFCREHAKQHGHLFTYTLFDEEQMV